MPSFNPFDAAVYICLVIAFIMGFNAGLLRSLATIFGYVAAMAVAVAAAPLLSRLATEQWHLPPLQNWMVLDRRLPRRRRHHQRAAALCRERDRRPGSGPDRPYARRRPRHRPHRAAGGAHRHHLRPHHSAGPRTGLSRRIRNCGRSCRRPAARACARCRRRSRFISTGSSASAGFSSQYDVDRRSHRRRTGRRCRGRCRAAIISRRTSGSTACAEQLTPDCAGRSPGMSR